MREPTMTNAPPVAQDGIDANMGAKNTEMKNANPVTIAVIPVFPPSECQGQTSVGAGIDTERVPLMPVALSMNAVTGLVPTSAPILIEKASTQYAIVEFSKSSVTGSRRPANFAMEYNVLQIRFGCQTCMRIRATKSLTRSCLRREKLVDQYYRGEEEE